MTPGARIQAAIECLDEIAGGAAAEKVLTGWARRSRFAGSKDRAAVRDHVYDVLRRRRSAGAWGGGDSGRALMLGLMRMQGADTGTLFSGDGYGPAALSPEEQALPEAGAMVDLPEWLIPALRADLGEGFDEMARAMVARAPVFLRVNQRKTDVNQAIESLSSSGVSAVERPELAGALEVVSGARQIGNAAAYRDGLVELQDLSSQAAMVTIPLRPGQRVLDYCAGGGGKTLALAGRCEARFFAHDANPGRMRDLPDRAARAGVEVKLLDSAGVTAEAPFDLVLCDVPCSGSGTWRRDPDGKWRFAPETLVSLIKIQSQILDEAEKFVTGAGVLAYATCSLLRAENDDQITAFIARHPGWQVGFQRQWSLSDGGDGFYVAHLTRGS